MEEQSLSVSFKNSISEEVAGVCSDFLEIGIDSILDEGVLKDIPFISTAVAVYKIGKSIGERNHLKKLGAFLDEINKNIISENDRRDYQNKLKDKQEFLNKELEYVLVIVDRYIGIEKPKMLAKLYLAYLDGVISWVVFTKYAEVIDRFLPGDCETLVSDTTYKTERDIDTDSIQRLIALGLVIEGVRTIDSRVKGEAIMIDSPESREIKERNYARTEFGNILVYILTKGCAKTAS